jgi:hypothetical protein
MSEKLWLRETDPLALLGLRYPMRSHGSTQPQSRQSRFYLLACARKQWARLPPVCRVLVGLAEVFAEAPRKEMVLHTAVAPVAEQLMHSAGDPDDLRSAEIGLLLTVATAHIGPDLDRARRVAHDPPPGPALTAEEWRGVAPLLYLPFEMKTPYYTWVPSALHDIELLRDVYGNPYRYVPFPAGWRTDTVTTFARTMYESREFSAMPIFADALEEAGCDNEEILEHCRSGKPHVRGCWVLDLVLGMK